MKNNNIILYKLYNNNVCVAYFRYDGVYYYSQKDFNGMHGIIAYFEELSAAIKNDYVDLQAFKRGLPPQFRLEVAK